MTGEPADATPFLPDGRASLRTLAEAIEDCRGCPLSALENHPVFGEGPGTARVMLVGEQPGDREDREGRPFVGPAGRELDRVLAAAGIERGETYVTNAVKRFKFKETGKRRLHDKPSRTEVKACRPWLEREIDLVRPEAVVALGATAAQSLFGPAFRVTREHGVPVETDLAALGMATIHPSAILRARGDEDRRDKREMMVADLTELAHHLEAA